VVSQAYGSAALPPGKITLAPGLDPVFEVKEHRLDVGIRNLAAQQFASRARHFGDAGVVRDEPIRPIHDLDLLPSETPSLLFIEVNEPRLLKWKESNMGANRLRGQSSDCMMSVKMNSPPGLNTRSISPSTCARRHSRPQVDQAQSDRREPVTNSVRQVFHGPPGCGRDIMCQVSTPASLPQLWLARRRFQSDEHLRMDRR